MREDDEGTAARRLDYDGQELRVHRTKRRVPRTLRHSYIVITLLPLRRLPVHMAEFRTTHHPKRHLQHQKRTIATKQINKTIYLQFHL